MRRDCVTQVIVRWRDGEEDNFATPFEAENYINWALDELGEPEAAWLEDMQGRKNLQVVKRSLKAQKRSRHFS